MSTHITKHRFKISKKDRNRLNSHKSLLIWFTGLSGSGKSTLADTLEKELMDSEIRTYILDGDNVRTGLNKDLGFSPEHRTENIRRIAEIAKLMTDAGLVVLSAFVSPYREDRASVKRIIGEQNFIEVFVDTSLEECEKRDVKGLYKKARKGEITNMTGIGAPYEAPENADVVIKTEETSIDDAVRQLLAVVLPKIELKNE
ncbi:adenylyl-sulfate kinase [Winogradskyella maritima]|nr:adenylyl-sulfate kinase [Winogradskyella maritima]